MAKLNAEYWLEADDGTGPDIDPVRRFSGGPISPFVLPGVASLS